MTAGSVIAAASPFALMAMVGATATGEDWATIDQQRIDAFAVATGDQQWIHTDPDRAATGPFGATIAHGFLTLSLLSVLNAPLLSIEGVAMAINYGLERVRFLQPVTVDSRVRSIVSITSADASKQGVRVGLNTVIEIDGSERPALVADSIVLYVPVL